MNKDAEMITIFAIITATIIVLMSVIFTEHGTTKRMKRQSLEGYTASATYQTNSVGEVTIEKIDWKKK